MSLVVFLVVLAPFALVALGCLLRAVYEAVGEIFFGGKR